MANKKTSKTKKIGTEEIKNEFTLVKSDIRHQLDTLKKYGKFYDDLLDEYMYLIEVREELKQDILDKGIRYKFTNGNGKRQERPNESTGNLIKIEQIMLKIINDLGINQPSIPPPSNNEPNSVSPKEDEENDLL